MTNRATLNKLLNNPHYKLSAKQKKELEDSERPSMITFGEPHVHNTTIPKHDILKRRKS